MTLEDSIHGLRLRAMQRAQALGNVSAACRELGISRALYYRWHQRFVLYGPDGLHPRRRRARVGRPPQVAAHAERMALGLALAWPTWGPNRLAVQLARGGVRLAPSTIYRLLRRSSSRSSVVKPGSAPSSIRACLIQSRSELCEMPKSRAI